MSMSHVRWVTVWTVGAPQILEVVVSACMGTYTDIYLLPVFSRCGPGVSADLLPLQFRGNSVAESCGAVCAMDTSGCSY